MAEITVFLARAVRTMEPSLAGGGSGGGAGWSYCRGWDTRDVASVAGFPQPRDRRHVQGPLHDAGVHRSPPASLHGRHAAAYAVHLTATGWELPWEDIPPVGDGERFLARLVEIEAGSAPRRAAVRVRPTTRYGTASIDRRALNEILGRPPHSGLAPRLPLAGGQRRLPAVDGPGRGGREEPSADRP